MSPFYIDISNALGEWPSTDRGIREQVILTAALNGWSESTVYQVARRKWGLDCEYWPWFSRGTYT